MTVKSKKERRAEKESAVRREPRRTGRSGHGAAFKARDGRALFLSRFDGLCFRCLSSEHRRIDCRDPLKCIVCKLPGHYGRECPRCLEKKKGGSTPRRGPVKDRLRFPIPPPSSPMDRGARLIDPSWRARASHKVVISTLAMEHQEFLLRKHAVLLTAAMPRHAASPLSVGRTIEEQLRTPPHLRVTSHNPEDFFIYFELPAHHENAVRRGSITVDDVVFNIKPWHEDDHASHDDFKLHVRVVIEKMPMQLWSLEGAAEVIGDKCIVDRLDSRTHERGHTKIFVCWVWVWDTAHIPTRRIIWRAKRGAGRVEAMLGFSLPSREVAPQPGVRRHDLLVHIDRVEDWTPPSPWSSHSHQSGLPSSDSDDGRPFPAIYPAVWSRHVEDGQGQGRRQSPAVAPSGCQGLQLGGARRDRDEPDGGQGGHRRSWKDTLLGRGYTSQAPQASKEQAAPPRHRSRTPYIRW